MTDGERCQTGGLANAGHHRTVIRPARWRACMIAGMDQMHSNPSTKSVTGEKVFAFFCGFGTRGVPAQKGPVIEQQDAVRITFVYHRRG